jgi:immune inhibitor A
MPRLGVGTDRAPEPRWPGLVNRAEKVKRARDGSREILVLLGDFSDNAQSYGRERFDTLLFGPVSVRGYYLEASYGGLAVGGTVNGWNRLDQQYSFYVGDSFGTSGDFPRNSQGLVADIVRRADPYVDFSRFDSDHDGVVDDLLVVHAGPGAEETGNHQDIWSHKWQLSDPVRGSPGPVQTNDGVTVDPFSVEPERFADGRLVSIGVFCHEFGHQLGLPDLYDTDYSSSGLGAFCLMAAGSWGRVAPSDPPGSSPVHPCAWLKSLLGWTRSDSIEPGGVDSLPGARIRATALGPSGFRLLKNPDGVDWTPSLPGSGEYFLVENRERTGYDRGLPGDGLLILHVDESRSGNSDEKHPLVGILQADGSPAYALPADDRGTAADLWKSSDTGCRSFTTPSTAYFDGVQSGVSISKVSAADSVMTASLAVQPLFLGSVYSFPNPVVVRLSSDRATIVYTPTDTARLAGRYPEFRVRLFDIAGGPVRVLDDANEVDPGHRAAFWDLKDEKRRPAASGLYFFTVEMTEAGVVEQATGQLTIVR